MALALAEYLVKKLVVLGVLGVTLRWIRIPHERDGTAVPPRTSSAEVLPAPIHQVPRSRVLGSCAGPCNLSYLYSLYNTAGLTSPAPLGEEAADVPRSKRAFLRRAG